MENSPLAHTHTHTHNRRHSTALSHNTNIRKSRLPHGKFESHQISIRITSDGDLTACNVCYARRKYLSSELINMMCDMCLGALNCRIPGNGRTQCALQLTILCNNALAMFAVASIECVRIGAQWHYTAQSKILQQTRTRICCHTKNSRVLCSQPTPKRIKSDVFICVHICVTHKVNVCAIFSIQNLGSKSSI